MTGVKILAGLLVFGLTFSAPATAWAAEGGLTEVTSNGSENGEKFRQNPLMGVIHLQKYQILSWR